MENITTPQGGGFLLLTLARRCYLYSSILPWQEESWSPGWALLCQRCSCLGAVTDASCKRTTVTLVSASSHRICCWVAANSAAQGHNKSRTFGQGAARVRWAGGMLGWRSQDLDVNE